MVEIWEWPLQSMFHPLIVSIVPDFSPSLQAHSAWKNSFAPVGLKSFLNFIASLTKSEMFEPGMVSPSIFTCPILSHVITSGFAFKRHKSAVALARMVLGMDSTTLASDNCGSARCSSFLGDARCSRRLFLSPQL